MATIPGTCHSMDRLQANLSPDRGVLMDISNNLLPLVSSPILAITRILVPVGHGPRIHVMLWPGSWRTCHFRDGVPGDMEDMPRHGWGLRDMSSPG